VKRLVTACVAVALTVGVAIPTFAAARAGAAKKPAAKKGGWAVCREHPILHISPPLTGSPHPATFSVSDVLESCSSSDPTIDRGFAHISAKTTSAGASCNGGALTGVARIRWNNGRTSRVNFGASFGAGFARARGQIVGGSEFVGRRFAALDHLNVDAIALQLEVAPVAVEFR